jgi:3-dehydroquinate synthase/shikimate kinase/3-dehydroquinate synthase
MKLKVKTNINNYSVIIGRNLCSKINKIIFNENIYSQKFLLVYDSKVPAQMIKSILSRFNKKKIEKKKIIFNEKSKNLKTVSSIVKILEKRNFSRNDCLISVGGGICGDVCGFASSIFKRGLNFINVPTTLLSQVDSAIGGKTGVNSLSGKNMIGSFYQPSLVISDIDFLKSLPKKEMICGYAEILKHSLIKNKIFFKFLKKNFIKILSNNHQFLERAIYKSCLIKKEVVEKDEKEKNIRKVLNLGHTFAHAYEATIGYNKGLNHGEAVLLGIMSAVEFGRQKNILKKNDYQQIIDHLKKLNYCSLNKYFKSKDISKIIFYMKQDKKNKDSKINLILLKSIAKPVLNKSFEENNIRSFLKNLIYR